MINKSALTSKLIACSLLMAGIVGIAPRAIAEDIPFTGTVNSSCAITDITPGSLALQSGGVDTIETTLDATFKATCNVTTATVTMGSVTSGTDHTGEAVSDITVTRTVSGGTLTLNESNTSGTATFTAGTPEDFTATLSATATDGVMDAGKYAYSFAVTVTP